MLKKLVVPLNGFLMAFADSVPGVSGGTVAFLSGIYDDFISSLNNILSRDGEKRKKALLFLIKLGAGWVIGFAAAVTILAELFTKEIYTVSSVFMGFIVFSIPLVIKEEKEALSKNYANAVFALIGAAIVVITVILGGSDGKGGLDLASMGITDYLYLFAGGAAAVSAMVLPGISGSTVMLILGIYVPAITAVRDLLKFDLGGLKILIPAGLGILFGALLIIKLIKAGLEKHRGAVIYLIAGMMTASVYAIIKGPESLDVPQPPITLETFSILGFILGGAVIGGLQLFKHLKTMRNEE